MIERLDFLIAYVGSAALTAFLAACLTSPQVATFTCDSSDANNAQTCELAATMASGVPEAGAISAEYFEVEAPAPKAAAITPD